MEHLKEASSSKVSIFAFTDFRSYLKAACLPNGSYSHQSNNLKKWSRRLGYKSPSSLAMVLGGQRLPSTEILQGLADSLQWSAREKEYFFALVELEKAKKKGKDTKKVLEKLAKFSSENEVHKLSLAEFQILSDWYFLAIKNLISCDGFQENTDWIRKKLRNKVTNSQVEHALTTLEKCGVIQRLPNGKLSVVQQPWRTDPKAVSSAIRRHHAGMIHLALEALEEQRPEDRQYMGLSLKFSPKKMEAAKKKLADFLESFNQEFFDESSQEIFQLNLQLFSLTTPNPTKEPLQ